METAAQPTRRCSLAGGRPSLHRWRRPIALLSVALFLSCWTSGKAENDDDEEASDGTNTSTTTSTTSTTTSTTSTSSSSTTTTTREVGTVSFHRLGGGECLAPSNRPVRGISQRDMDHGSCRAFCKNDNCLGYNYAPCEMICTVYGDPQALLYGEDSTVWNAISGWSSISTTSETCGSTCFVRMNPCLGGEVRSAGAVMDYSNITYHDTITVFCPYPYTGSLDLYCDVAGVKVVSGRCQRQCPGGTYYDESFEVTYPSSLHGEYTVNACPRGAQGNITMYCDDGEAEFYSGACGYNCQAGSLRAGSGIVMYAAMKHQATTAISCPSGWTGSPVVTCFNSMVTLSSGRCDKHCVASEKIVKMGWASDVVEYPLIEHDTSVTLECPSDTYAGNLTLSCSDGTVTLDENNTNCARHCRPGNVSSAGEPNDYISIRRNVSHGVMLHESRETLECNRGYSEFPRDEIYIVSAADFLIYNMRLSDFDADSGYGTIVSEYKETLAVEVVDDVMWVVDAQDNYIYRLPLSMVGPTTIWDEEYIVSLTLLAADISIADGWIFALGVSDGFVYKQKISSMTQYTEWTQLSSEDADITAIAVYQGSIYATVYGVDTIIKKDQLTAFSTWDNAISRSFEFAITALHIAQDIVYVVANEKVYYQELSNLNTTSDWIGPISGKQPVLTLTMVFVNQTNAVARWVPGFVGELDLYCYDGSVILESGQCLMHCDAGMLVSNEVLISYGNMTHGSNSTLDCPETHAGSLFVWCNDGQVEFTGSCGLKCDSVDIVSNGATVTLPDILHSDDQTVNQSFACPDPYIGYIYARCYMGQLRTNGYCYKACNSGTWTRASSSATVKYPALGHGENYTGACVPIYAALSYSGSVYFECNDGSVISTGGCYADCTAGVIKDNGMAVEYNFTIEVGKTADVICSPSYWYGNVTLLCDRGLPEVYSGSCGQPCRATTFSSEATRDYDMTTPDIPHGWTAWVTCPEEVSGKLLLKCRSNRLQVLNGTCGERCYSRSLDVYGATFISPTMDHKETYQQDCMSPFLGKVDVSCEYGELTVTSSCTQGCWAGNTTIDSGALIVYPNMVSGEEYETSCPTGYAGFVTLTCVDQTPEVTDGACYSHCLQGRYIGDSWNVVYEPIYHGETEEIDCGDDYDGYVILQCNDGTVELAEGNCYGRCASGRYTVRSGIVLRHSALGHEDLTASMECPDGFVGSVRLICLDGEMSIYEGYCYAHCDSGGVQGAKYSYMLHTETASLICPVAGSIEVTCYDGDVVVNSGECYVNCAAGSIRDENHSLVQYPAIEHLGTTTGTCAGNSTGYVQVTCDNGIVSLTPLLGQRCYRHCSSGSLVTSDGSLITSPSLEHDQRTNVKCTEDIGTVTVRCDDGVSYIASGYCGEGNCPAGSLVVGDASVYYPEINDDEETEFPQECEGAYLGEAVLGCADSVVEVINITFLYPAVENLSAMDFNASKMSAEFLKEHEDEYFHLCGCCIPAPVPEGADPIAGVDLRKIIVWAVCVGVVGAFLATATGLYFLRPDWCRRSKTRVHPTDFSDEGQIVAYENADASSLRDAGRPQLRALYDKEVPPDW